MSKRHIEVSAAVIWQEGRLLATQRGYGNYKDWWEFPGGKLESGESAEAALRREIREEMEAELDIQRLLMTVEYEYPEFCMTMHCFLCTFAGPYRLLEHEAARWLTPAEFDTVRWLPADDVVLQRLRKEHTYELLTRQVAALAEGEYDRIALMANTAALVHETFHFWWTGFYRVEDNELTLGPFQGPVACMHIGYGKGVCGTAWKERRTLIVPEVEQFPGHIACSAASRSEIVVPLLDSRGNVTAVLDIDSRELNTFDTTDQYHLEKIIALLP